MFNLLDEGADTGTCCVVTPDRLQRPMSTKLSWPEAPACDRDLLTRSLTRYTGRSVLARRQHSLRLAALSLCLCRVQNWLPSHLSRNSSMCVCTSYITTIQKLSAVIGASTTRVKTSINVPSLISCSTLEWEEKHSPKIKEVQEKNILLKKVKKYTAEKLHFLL